MESNIRATVLFTLLNLLHESIQALFNPLYSRNLKMSSSANSDDPDEMQHYAIHFTRVYIDCKSKKDLQTKENNNFFKKL